MSNRILVGLLLVALGVMFLLDTTKLAGDGQVVGTYWPALLIGWGVWNILKSGFRIRLSSGIILAVGAILLLSNLELWAWNIGQLWPLLLVLLGLALLSSFGRPGRWLRRNRHQANSVAVDVKGSSSSGESSYFFSGGKERVTSKEYRGGSVSAVCGGLELDLREAQLAERQAVLDVTVFCGGLELLVPPDWVVSMQPSVFLGGTESRRKQPLNQEASGELIITGSVFCGGIEVKD